MDSNEQFWLRLCTTVCLTVGIVTMFICLAYTARIRAFTENGYSEEIANGSMTVLWVKNPKH